MAKGALTAQLALVDPEWGGVYQYSTGGKWDEPHFEKIMEHQANNLRLFSVAFARWNDMTFLNAAVSISGYMKKFLMSPEGAFYVSQDADLIQGVHSDGFFKLKDAERRVMGIPRVDTHVYSRENGWAIS